MIFNAKPSFRCAPIAFLLATPGVVSLAMAGGIAYRAVELNALPGGETVPTIINNAGVIAGRSGSSSIELGMHAFASDNGGPLENINTLGFAWSEAQAINGAGQVAGQGCWFDGQGCINTLFRYDPGMGMRLLSCFAGNWGAVHDINGQGDVVGYWRLNPTSWEAHAFVATDDIGIVDLGTLGGSDSQALAVNNARQVVGYSLTAAPNSWYHGFFWNDGQMKDVGTLGGNWSYANDINDAGQVVGVAADAEGAGRAFRWTVAGGMQDLQTLPGVLTSEAKFINAAGMVAGTYLTGDGRTRGFVFTDATGMVDIGLVNGFDHVLPSAMNSAGNIVGLVASRVYEITAFFWSADTGMVRLENALLNEPAWTISSAIAINDAGQIVSGGFDITHGSALLLNPACIGDLDGDAEIGLGDLSRVLSGFGSTGIQLASAGDLNADGGVDLTDLALLLGRFGSACD